MTEGMHKLTHVQLLTYLMKLFKVWSTATERYNKRVGNDFEKGVTCHPCKILGSTLILSNELLGKSGNDFTCRRY